MSQVDYTFSFLLFRSCQIHDRWSDASLRPDFPVLIFHFRSLNLRWCRDNLQSLQDRFRQHRWDVALCSGWSGGEFVLFRMVLSRVVRTDTARLPTCGILRWRAKKSASFPVFEGQHQSHSDEDPGHAISKELQTGHGTAWSFITKP